MSSKHKLFFLSFMLHFLLISSCASNDITFKIEPNDANIFLLDPKSIDTKNSTPSKGELKTTKEALHGKILLFEHKDKESLLLLPMNISESDTIFVKPRLKNTELEKKISELEAKLESEKNLNQQMSEKLLTYDAEKHKIAQLLVRIQIALIQQLPQRADELTNELFKIPETVLPSSAFTLRGKMRLMQNRRSEAKQDFARAMQLSPSDKDAKSFMENIP